MNLRIVGTQILGDNALNIDLPEGSSVVASWIHVDGNNPFKITNPSRLSFHDSLFQNSSEATVIADSRGEYNELLMHVNSSIYRNVKAILSSSVENNSLYITGDTYTQNIQAALLQVQKELSDGKK